jgi:imidazolonepropionase-like amidohydrolase
MRNVSLLLLFLFLPSACAAQEPEPTQPAIAFVGVDVVTMANEGMLEDHTVVVQADRVVSVGPSATTGAPKGAVVVDGRGRFLMPGLAEMHGHIPPPDAPRDHVEAVLFLYVANGITTVRGMLGFPGQLELKERASRGEIVAPNLYLAGPSFSGSSIESPEQAVERVRRQHAEGWDLLKVHPGLTRAEYDAMARTARELEMRFGGHVPEDVGLLHALAMGQETFDHLDGYPEYLEAELGHVDEAKLVDVVGRTRAAGAWVVPTLALWETLLGAADLDTLRSYPELRYAPPEQVAQWIATHEQRLASPPLPIEQARQLVVNRLRILAALHDGGVRVLMGTDAPQQFSVPGFSLHRELRRMTDAGLSPYEVLVTGTRNVGAYFANEDDFGTVAPGKRADLILLGADPLTDVANVAALEGVMVRGRWLPRAEIDARLEAIAAMYAGEGS